MWLARGRIVLLRNVAVFRLWLYKHLECTSCLVSPVSSRTICVIALLDVKVAFRVRSLMYWILVFCNKIGIIYGIIKYMENLLAFIRPRTNPFEWFSFRNIRTHNVNGRNG